LRRETSNRMRFVIEDLLPPRFRDGKAFRLLARTLFGPAVDVAADFRKRAAFLTDDEYTDFYRAWTGPHLDTDNSQACLDRIAAEIVGTSVCDVGCGTGYLLRFLRDRLPARNLKLTGAEMLVPDPAGNRGIEFFSTRVEKLPFADRQFDTVICTHVIEHVLDYRAAIAELRRIAARRLIVVVPMEREALYGFNLHVNFFPYPHSFQRAMMPVPPAHVCALIGRDIYYREDVG